MGFFQTNHWQPSIIKWMFPFIIICQNVHRLPQHQCSKIIMTSNSNGWMDQAAIIQLCIANVDSHLSAIQLNDSSLAIIQSTICFTENASMTMDAKHLAIILLKSM